MPIKSITCRSKDQAFSYPVAEEQPGPACVKLLSTLKGIQQGKIEDKFGWLDVVPEPPAGIRKVGKDADENMVDSMP